MPNTNNQTTYPSRDEVFEFLEPRVDKFPFKAKVEKVDTNKIVISQVLYDRQLKPNGSVELYTLTFENNQPVVGFFIPRETYFGGETPRAIWRSIARLIGKPQMYDL